MASLWSSLLELLYPRQCAACAVDLAADRDPHALFCDLCAGTMIRGDGTTCPSCGVVWLDPPAGVGSHVCGRCIAEPPPWIGARGAFAYGGALQDAIARWKNRPDESLGPLLARLMCDSHAINWDDMPPDACVVPVPATPHGLARRGFNPAGILGRRVARQLGRRFEPCALHFRRSPEGSRGLGRKARERRMRGVFEAQVRRVEGRSILLVDDVMTTGATVKAATEALLRGGARGVRIAVLARVPGATP